MQLIDRGQEPAPEVVREDARTAFRILKAGGVAVLPFTVSYAIFGHTARAVERVYELKNRKPTKPNGVIGNWDILTGALQTTPRDRDLVKCIVEDNGLPLSVVARFDREHPWLQACEWGALRRSTKGDTMDLLLNAGTLHNELARLSWEGSTPLFGSSANKSLSGSKFEVYDVEADLKAGCDLVIGYGRSLYANRWLIGSTIIELPTWKILRFGGCYEQQAEIIRKHFGHELPPRPTEGSMSLV
jgi:tRNA A37 threonylcarbamoyladenosine synthetase subunit TsaC/SUA5/YrdC